MGARDFAADLLDADELIREVLREFLAPPPILTVTKPPPKSFCTAPIPPPVLPFTTSLQFRLQAPSSIFRA